MILTSCGHSTNGNSSYNAEATIGTQIWMSENLNVDKFRNGDPILEVKTNEEWVNAAENKQPAWCYYDNDPANDKKYGKIYNWYAVNDSRGLAPAGWHIPSDEEWTQLTNHLSGEREAGSKMKSTSGWALNGNGTNSSGFSGLPGGLRTNMGAFGYIGNTGTWWSSSEKTFSNAWLRSMNCYSGKVEKSWMQKNGGAYVRCIKD